MGLVKLYGHEAFVHEAYRRLKAGESPDTIIKSFTGMVMRPEAPVRIAELLLWREAHGGTAQTHSRT